MGFGTSSRADVTFAAGDTVDGSRHASLAFFNFYTPNAKVQWIENDRVSDPVCEIVVH